MHPRLSNSWKTIMFWERPFFWFTLYVSWNCNQTFITEKLNAYSRSSSTRGEGPSLASKSVEEIVFSVLLLLRASYRKICGVFIAFTHIWLWSQTGDWRYEYEYTDTSCNLISWWCCGGPFSNYINTSDFPDPGLSRAELNNLTYLTFWCWWTALSPVFVSKPPLVTRGEQHN